jgi:hypothetical protein
VTKLGQRAEVQPVVIAPNGGCFASTEVYLTGLPRTILLPGNIQSGVLGSPAIEVQGT